MKKSNQHTESIARRKSPLWKIVPTLGAATWLLPMTSWAVLPDDLTLNVGDIDNDGQDEVVVLIKRSMRSATNHKLMTWDSIAGYQQVTAPEVRTYRGYVQDDPSMRVNANIEPGNATMNANFSDGHELNYRLTAVPVTISGADGTSDPGTGNVVVPFVEDRVAPTANHYIVPTHHMRRLDYAVTIKNDYYVGMGSDIEAAVSRVEQRMNDTDFFYARDIGMAHEIGWMVVNLEENLDSWHNEWTNVHKPNGAVYDMRGLFKKPGGAGASGDCFLGGRHTAGTLAAYSKSQGHELGHTLGGGHYSSWGDVMSGSESAIGSGTVERMIGNAAVATEAQSPALDYGSPLPPFAMEDCVTMLMDTTLDIDVLENDYDGNGDAITISHVDATTEKGGTAEIINGKVRYTPPAHWQGQDTFVYHVEDATGIANRAGYVKVAVHNNGLATHIMLDETTGTVAHDVGPFQAHGTLDQGFAFDANSVAGVAGNALERTAVDHVKSSADFWGTGDPLNGDLSVSLWVKYQSGAPTVAGPVICKGGSVIRGRFENPRGGWTIGHTADGKFRFLGNLNRDSQYTYDNPQFDLEASSSISNNTWHHLVMVMDRDTKQLRAWVDNQELSTTEFGIEIADGVIDNSHHPLVIFDSVSQQSQSTDTPVTVDDVQIYHKALTPADVADLYNNPNADVAAGAPSPANGTTDAIVGQDLSWIPGKTSGYDYDVFIGTDYDTVLNATTASPEYKGQQAGTNYTPSVTGGTRHFWRIDQIDGATTEAGDVWWFEGESFSPLNDPAILNASVEDPDLASGATSNNINDWFDATAYTWTQDDGSVAHPDTPYGDNWIELGNGRWIYQQIGTYEEGMDLDITFLAGQPDGNTFDGITVELLVGGGPALAADHNSKRSDAGFGLEATVGASVIATSGQLDPFPSSGQATQEMTVSLSTGTGHSVGDPLWLLLSRPSTGGRSLIDNVQVVHTNAAPSNGDPVFNANPISEEYVTVGKDYNSSLADNASDPDGDSLTFSKVSGPAWLIIGTDGELTGIPQVGDDGLNTFTAQIDDGNGGVATTQVEIDVLPDTKAPSAPATLVANAGDGSVSLDWDDNSETDFDSYTVSRSTTSGSGYVSIATGLTVSDYVDSSAANGTTYYYVVTAVDTSGNESGNSAESSASPVAPNSAPTLSDFTGANGTEDLAYSGSVTSEASDPDAGDTLTFSKVSGPAWLTVSGGGSLSGIPANGDVGANLWTLRVTDSGGLSDDASLQITIDAVIPPADPPSNPSIVDGATGVELTPSLTWGAASGADSYDIYFGAIAPGDFKVNQTNVDYDPGTLVANTTYYWRVDTVNGSGTTTGTVWSFTTAAGAPSTLFSDDFESGSLSNWATSGSVSAHSSGANAGIYGVRLKETSSITATLDTSAVTSVTLEYDRSTAGYDSGEQLTVEWSSDGSNWTTVENTNSSSWATTSVVLPAGAAGQSALRIRFSTNANKTNEKGYVDNVTVTGQ